jgi:hypothetical protein
MPSELEITHCKSVLKLPEFASAYTLKHAIINHSTLIVQFSITKTYQLK